MPGGMQGFATDQRVDTVATPARSGMSAKGFIESSPNSAGIAVTPCDHSPGPTGAAGQSLPGARRIGAVPSRVIPIPQAGRQASGQGGSMGRRAQSILCWHACAYVDNSPVPTAQRGRGRNRDHTGHESALLRPGGRSPRDASSPEARESADGPGRRVPACWPAIAL